MTKIRHYIKAIALILCFTLQLNSANAQTWPPTGMQEDDNEEYHFSEQKTTSAFSIYPSPTSNTITIYSDSNFHTIEIVDILGKVVHYQTNNKNNITLDVSNYSTGVYFVRIMNEEEFKIQKFVKK